MSVSSVLTIRVRRIFGRLPLSLISIFVLCCVCRSYAAEPIPDESGWGGYITIGAGWMQVKSNTVAGTSWLDFGNDNISSLNKKPDSDSTAIGLLTGELKYTFADSRTQLFFGNSIEDWFRFDLTSAVGVRQELSDKSILEGGFLFSSFPTKVWKDPFMTGVDRKDTDRTSYGARFSWGNLFDENFDITYDYREIDIDDELSGSFLGLAPNSQKTLDRNGRQHRVSAVYKFHLNDSNILAPTLTFNRFDLDGDAVSNDRYGIKLTHVYTAEKFQLITNLAYAFADFDKRHPIYSKTRKDDQYGVTSTLMLPNLFGKKQITGMLSAVYWYQNSNIKFYKSEVIAFTAGTLIRF